MRFSADSPGIDDDAKRWADRAARLVLSSEMNSQQAARHLAVARTCPAGWQAKRRRAFVIALAMVVQWLPRRLRAAISKIRAPPMSATAAWRAVANSMGYIGRRDGLSEASGPRRWLSLHPLQPAVSSHVCTLRRSSPGWRTLPRRPCRQA